MRSRQPPRELSGECDLSLAGGASLRVPHDQGYFYQPGGIASPDGHCRSFDARAAGTVGGDGAGVVTLKRLEDALADGDRIRAVIRGSAVNNDGAHRAGYTAPSVQGQSRVIRAALATAQVSPQSIGYVEAHGSATPLGDPTEVEALKQVFCSASKQPARERSCGLGSVKTNIGHLDAAAGVASLIKTVLCLEQGQIAPSLHFEQLNPQIQFEGSPFFVSTALIPWPGKNGALRRAGVSSFGLGGTNAHVVLEQAPKRASRRGAETQREAGEGIPANRSAQLLVWSGHSQEAADEVGSQLARHLERNTDLDLADVAFTLQAGRRVLRHRRMLVSSGRQDAAQALADQDPKRILRGVCGPEAHPVFFLFSGLGDHYLGMGRGLYEEEPAFREAVDRCCQILQPHLGLDLREVLYPPQEEAAQKRPGRSGEQVDLRALMGRSKHRQSEAEGRLDQTALAQPAVFVLGHALSKLWEEWGVRPAGAIGYSLGEYLAACQAGVLSLEDALQLVAGRARLIQELPAGGMLAVPLGAAEIQEFLGRNLCLAATNAPSLSVLAGPLPALDELEGRLKERGLASRRLRTLHAFHSSMMQGVAKRFGQLVSRIKLRPPAFPYLSNVTGGWIQPQEATDPDYWVRHLCGTARFSEGLQELLQKPGGILLEVGPGQTLGTFARQHFDEDPNRAVIASLPAEDDATSDSDYLSGALGRLWLAGGEVDWESGHQGWARRRVALPLYPFQRQRYWVERVGGEVSGRDAETQRGGRGVQSGQEAPAPDTGRKQAPRHERPNLPNVYVAPRDEAEETVCGILQEMLGVREIGLHDNFFELGGHSLLATQIVARFLERFRVEVPLRTFSDAPTAAQMVQVIQELRRQEPESRGVPQLPRVQADPESAWEPFPLTDVQRAYWVGRSEKLELGNVATHSYLENDLKGIDLKRYELAWQRLIDRHPMLRVVFLADGRQKTLQKVPPFRLKILDLRGKDPQLVAAKLEEIRQTLSHQMLPTDQWPLFDIRATLLEDGIVRLHKSVDYLVFDAWSAEILAREHNLFYQDPEADLPALEITFRDYVLAEAGLQQTEFYRRSRRYWLDRLDDLPPAPDLPL
ncbi:MAG: acyltransferase domain-containing protein, partial [Acidobacteriota bacterium]